MIRRIAERAARCGIALDDPTAAALARHAALVLEHNDELHLTTITDPAEFLERHIGEAFEGAAMLPADATGHVLDLGSGNGYPGAPFVAARPGLELTMTDASVRRSEFLRRVVAEAPLPRTTVVEAQIQRPADLFDPGPYRALVSRAMGGWEKIVPRMAPALDERDGEVLLWAGDEVERVMTREVWRKRLVLRDKRALPGREASWVWRFGRV